MKKIFGSKVVLAEQRNNRSRVRTRNAHHKHWLVVPKSSWPNPAKTGLSMKFLGSSSSDEFTFEHSPSYREVQTRFFRAVESMHPDFIVEILNSNPFHVDSMLQLSEICKMGEDNQMATELVERSLFAMEAAFHPLFNLGTSRLDYRRQENRSLFLALFRHMVYVGSRACYRTALELAKLTLSLDPERDPLGVLLMVDFYALRSGQFGWLVELDEEWEKTKNLSMLPNFSYSVALACFHLGRKNEEMMAVADERLKRALIMFPSVLLPLLDKCSIEPDARAATHKFFLGAGNSLSAGLKILTGLYVGRSFHVWKEPHVLPWLERNVNEVLDSVDSGKDEFVTECEGKRKTRYQGTPRNVFRHVIISDVKDATSALPTEISSSPILSYDPLPPLDSIDTYQRTSRPESSGAAGSDNPFRLFFSSMLPNFNPADEVAIAAAAAAEAEGAAGGQQTGDLRRSVTTLLDAMQDLLGGLHLPELPNDGAASADSEDDDDDWE